MPRLYPLYIIKIYNFYMYSHTYIHCISLFVYVLFKQGTSFVLVYIYGYIYLFYPLVICL